MSRDFNDRVSRNPTSRTRRVPGGGQVHRSKRSKSLDLQGKVFISYAHSDWRYARALAKMLDDIRIPYFLDKKDIKWGESITERVAFGIGECCAVIVVMSPASLTSAWVPFELGRAVGAGVAVLPFLAVATASLPGYLRDLRFIRSVAEARSELGNSAAMHAIASPSNKPFSGRYLSLTWALGSDRVLLEEVVCTHGTVDQNRVSGAIRGVSILERGRGGKYRPAKTNRGKYAFQGVVDARVVAIRYHAIPAERHGTGAFVLKADNSGATLSGRWSGVAGEVIADGVCTWTRLDARVRSDADLVRRAQDLLPLTKGDDSQSSASSRHLAVGIVGLLGTGKSDLFGALVRRLRAQEESSWPKGGR